MLATAVLAMTHASVSAAPHRGYVGTSLGGRLTLAPGSPILGRASVDGAGRWNERWHTGLRISFDLGGDSQIYEAVGELGIVLHASRELDVLLGWRAGYGRFHFNDISIDTYAIGPMAEIFYFASERVQIRFAPFGATAYNGGLWELMIGPEVGVLWSF